MTPTPTTTNSEVFPGKRIHRALRVMAAVSSLAWGSGACGGSRSTPAVPRAGSERGEEPYVAAQTEFSIALVDPIEKADRFGRRMFRARVEYPVRALNNDIVIQTNALVRGEVVAIETAPLLLVKLEFHEIETIWGPTRLAATVRSAEPYALVSIAPSHDGPRFDAALYPLRRQLGAPAGPAEHAAAVGGGPRAAADRAEIILPAGTQMRLVLAEPVVPPRRTNAWQ